MNTTLPPQAASDRAPIAGPADRASFFDEQRRRQRQSWRISVLCALLTALLGVPLSMVLTPALFLAAVGTLRVAEQLIPIPEAAWSTLRDLARFVPEFLTSLLATLTDTPPADLLAAPREALTALRTVRPEDLLPALSQTTASVALPFGSPHLTLAALILPGTVAITLAWLGYRALFREAGVGGALLTLGAREPRLDDLEERQLVNLVEEMAIAAGLPPPPVRLLDSPAPNAAAVGAAPGSAVLVVSRGLLDRMDRDETQAVIAHLIGSLGNGDLRIALSITTAFQAVQLVCTVFDAVFHLSRTAWRNLLLLARLWLSPRSDPQGTRAVAEMLDHHLSESRRGGLLDDLEALLDRAEAHRTRLAQGTPPRHVEASRHVGPALLRSAFALLLLQPYLLLSELVLGILRLLLFLLRIVLLPLHLLFGLFLLHVKLISEYVIGPLTMRIWRARRYLADATAVQLTRNPDGMARALARLAAQGTVVPGGQWFTHLFIVGPEARLTAAPAQRIPHSGSGEYRRVFSAVAVVPRDGPVREDDGKVEVASRKVSHVPRSTWQSELASAASHPPIAQRLERLRALGARLEPAAGPGKPRWKLRRPRWETRSDLRAFLWSLPAAAFVIFVFALAALAVGVIRVLQILFTLVAFLFSLGVYLFATLSAVLFMGLAMAGIHALLV